MHDRTDITQVEDTEPIEMRAVVGKWWKAWEQDEAKHDRIAKTKILANSLVLNPTLLNASLSFQTENTKQNVLVLSDNRDLSNKPDQVIFIQGLLSLTVYNFYSYSLYSFYSYQTRKLIKPNGKTI